MGVPCDVSAKTRTSSSGSIAAPAALRAARSPARCCSPAPLCVEADQGLSLRELLPKDLRRTASLALENALATKQTNGQDIRLADARLRAREGWLLFSGRGRLNASTGEARPNTTLRAAAVRIKLSRRYLMNRSLPHEGRGVTKLIVAHRTAQRLLPDYPVPASQKNIGASHASGIPTSHLKTFRSTPIC